MMRIAGSRVVLRPFRPAEIDAEWRSMATADATTVPVLPDETRFRQRLLRSGHLDQGRLDLAIEADGSCAGRIQTFVPPNRPLPPGTFAVGMALREEARGQGYGREALTLLTNWLFEQAGAEVVQAQTDPANVAMQTVCQRAGWTLTGPTVELGREWLTYEITRRDWAADALKPQR